MPRASMLNCHVRCGRVSGGILCRSRAQVHGEVQSGEEGQRRFGFGVAHSQPLDPPTGVSEVAEGAAGEVQSPQVDPR
jgi:hypothetical protein